MKKSNQQFCKWRNRARTMQIVNKVASFAAPLFKDAIRAGFKLKLDGSLYKSDKQIFDEIVIRAANKFSIRPADIHYTFKYNNFTFYVKQAYQARPKDKHGYSPYQSYCKHFNIYRIEEKEFLQPDVSCPTYRELLKADKDQWLIKEKINSLEVQLYKIKNLLY